MRRWIFVALFSAWVMGCGAGPERPSQPYWDLEDHRAIERLEVMRETDPDAYRPYFTHDNPHVRARAARAMGRVWHVRVVPALIEIASREDESPTVLFEALFALGQLHDSRAEAVAIYRLAHESALVRRAAAQALGKLRTPAASDSEGGLSPRIATLVRALQDEDATVRGDAALALLWCGADQAVPDLIGHAQRESDPDARWRAAYALGRFDSPDTVELLLELISDPHPWVRAFAAAGLARPGSSESIEPLAWVIADVGSHWTARVNAIKSLRKLRSDGFGDADRIREIIVGRLHDERHPLVLEVLIAAIGDDDSEVAIGLLRALLAKPNSTLTERRAALRAYGRAAKERAVPVLVQELVAEDALIRTAAVDGLAHGGAAALEPLVARLDDVDLWVRTAALDALAQLPVEEKWDWVRVRLRDDDLAVRCTAVSAIIAGKPLGWLQSLNDVLDASSASRYWETRNTIIDALVAEGSPESNERVQQLLDDDHLGVCLRAQQQLGYSRPLSPTEQFLNRPYPRLDPWQVVARGHPRLTLRTTRGSIVMELYLRDAPEHVSSIVHLARSGFYDGLLFHRVVPAFVVQGGDPRTDGWGDNGRSLPHEINPHPYLRGSVGMPTAGPDTGGCQFFIDHLPTPHLDGKYTVFGRVILGMEVVDQVQVGDRIIEATVDENQFWRGRPGD